MNDEGDSKRDLLLSGAALLLLALGCLIGAWHCLGFGAELFADSANEPVRRGRVGVSARTGTWSVLLGILLAVLGIAFAGAAAWTARELFGGKRGEGGRGS